MFSFSSTMWVNCLQIEVPKRAFWPFFVCFMHSFKCPNRSAETRKALPTGHNCLRSLPKMTLMPPNGLSNELGSACFPMAICLEIWQSNSVDTMEILSRMRYQPFPHQLQFRLFCSVVLSRQESECMNGVTINEHCSAACRCTKQKIFQTAALLEECNDSFYNVAFACFTYASDEEQHLLHHREYKMLSSDAKHTQLFFVCV